MTSFQTYLQLLRLVDELAGSAAQQLGELQPGQKSQSPGAALQLDEAVATLKKIIRYQFCILDELSNIPRLTTS